MLKFEAPWKLAGIVVDAGDRNGGVLRGSALRFARYLCKVNNSLIISNHGPCTASIELERGHGKNYGHFYEQCSACQTR
jgi:hypothetical protein